MTKQIKIAIVGLGHIGKIHTDAILSNASYELVAVCDKNSAYQNIAKGVVFYESYLQMLEKGGFDVVVVATPNHTHAATAENILDHGCNVVLEKPAANSVDELKQLESLATQKQKHTYYAFHAAYASEVLWFCEYYKQNKESLGHINGFYSRFYDPYFAQDELVDHAKGLEHPWKDSGVNALSVLAWFLDLDHLILSSTKVSQCKAQEISHSRKYELKNHDFGIIETAWDQGKNFKCTELYFECGVKVELNHTAQKVILVDSNGAKKELKSFDDERLLNHYKNIFADYAMRIKNNKFNFDTSLAIHQKLYEEGKA